jgi:glutaminyl-peptide cyclotransferase
VGLRTAIPGTLAALAAAAVLSGCGGGGEADVAPLRDLPAGFDAERAFRDLEAQVRLGPRPAGSAASRRLTRLLAAGLGEAGVRGVRIQRPHRNVVGRIPGGEPGVVVLAAHHDTKNGIPRFVGANDGASGVAVVLEIARVLPDRLDGPSVHLALFDAEEARGQRPFAKDGARGSRQYVRYARAAGGRQGAPPLERIEALVLFDLVGDCRLRIPREANSDAGLYSLIAEAAGEVGEGGPFGGETGPILDDHLPFIEAGIPAVDLIDFDYGPGPSPGAWWHTPKDTLERVCPESLGAVGRAALAALPRIG